MTATAAQIAKIRRMVAEPTSTTYSDTLIQGFIEAHPLMDERGTEPYYWTTSGSAVPTKTANTDWIATYDLNAAAADIWEEKAAAVAALYDFKADGGEFTRSGAYDQAKNMANFYRSRTSIKLVRLRPAPVDHDVEYSQSAGYSWIANLPEDD